MAETMRSMASPTDEAAQYQPLALFSILSISLAGFFTALVLVLTAVGLYTRKPVLEPMLILFAVGGIVLSIAARWQIRNSEGTLAGTGMAKTAFWLCIIFGACYIAYYYGNALAIQKQAKDYVQERWLKAIRENDIEEATLLTMPPQMRKGMSKADVRQRFADQFNALQSIELVQVFQRAGNDHELISEGVKEWKQNNEGYEVILNYLLRTREGEFDISVLLLGVEGKEFTERQWTIRTGAPYIRSRRLTTYGRMIAELQGEANQFLQDWTLGKLVHQRYAEMYLTSLRMTQAERTRRNDEYVTRGLVGNALSAATTPGSGLIVAGALGAHFGDLGINRRIYLPGSENFAREIVFFDERIQQHPNSVKEEMLPRIIQPGTMTPAQNVKNMESPTRIELLPDEVRVSLPIDYVLPSPVNYRAGGRLIAGCWNEALMAKLNELGTAPFNGSQPVTPDLSPSVLKQYPHDWRVVQVYIDLARRRDDMRPGGGLPNMNMRPF